MSDEQSTGQIPVEPTPAPGAEEAPAAEAAPGAGDAWRDVVAELDALGDALGRWLKAAVNDPENKRRLDELSNRLDGLVSDVGTTVKGAADTEVGQSFKEAADKTGDAFKVAGEKFTSEVGPRLAGAFKTVGEKLRDAADKIEERQAPATTEPEPPVTPHD
ncbi:MAG: hypothetical protein ACYDHQ_10160 [Coriobacteriia bacterium]